MTASVLCEPSVTKHIIIDTGKCASNATLKNVEISKASNSTKEAYLEQLSLLFLLPAVNLEFDALEIFSLFL